MAYTVDDLINVLEREHKSLKAADWEDIAACAVEKDKICDDLTPSKDRKKAERLEALAAENTRLLAILKRAASGVIERLANAKAAAEAVGYSENGDRLSCDDSADTRRV